MAAVLGPLITAWFDTEQKVLLVDVDGEQSRIHYDQAKAIKNTGKFPGRAGWASTAIPTQRVLARRIEYCRARYLTSGSYIPPLVLMVYQDDQGDDVSIKVSLSLGVSAHANL